MNKTIKAKWVAALRSGNYRQCRGALRVTYKSGDQYCALGVLCDVVQPDWWHNTSKKWFHGYSADLPGLDLLELAGLDSNSRTILVSMNDEEKKSFTTIANWIDKNM